MRQLFPLVAILVLVGCGSDGGDPYRGPRTPLPGERPVYVPPADPKDDHRDERATYAPHKDITATVFWVGEPGNTSSAWDEKWQQHFGGVDDPKRRDGWQPAGFVPRQNPFYIALPYNDVPAGKRRADVERIIPWAKDHKWTRSQSMCKDQWVKISKGRKTCYAQWEDVGPFNTDDGGYVFGGDRPRNKSNKGAGIDLSPAVRDYLGLSGMDSVDWQFVDANDVPSGPWKKIVTDSGNN